MDSKIDSKQAIAEDFFTKAQEESYKPEEDVVAYSVCKNAYYSVKNYLTAYLDSKDVSSNEKDSVKDLLEKCRATNEKFNDLHLSPMYHPTETEDVWMNLDTARDYLQMAENTRELTLENL